MNSLNLSKAEALRAALRRLPENYPDRSFLEKEVHNAEAGVRGEQRLQKKFIEFYTKEPSHILWNVSLTLGNWSVQIDGLLLTTCAAIVIESKNISGDLYFNHETDEFYRTDLQGIKTVMDNPAVQVEKHKRFLKAWFQQQSIQLPVDGLLVFTAKQAELKAVPLDVHTCRLYQMTEKLFKLLANYPTPLYSKTSLEDVKHLIESKQTPYEQKPLSIQYSIPKTLFSNGIYCDSCNEPTIERQSRRWKCRLCGDYYPDALLQTTREYFALFGGPVTNRKIRHFSGIPDRHLIKRLLIHNNFLASGKRRHRHYSIE